MGRGIMTLQGMAWMCFLMPRLFREYAGCTFTEFLTRLRLQLAAELLHDPQMSIKEVIYVSGFETD